VCGSVSVSVSVSASVSVAVSVSVSLSVSVYVYLYRHTYTYLYMERYMKIYMRMCRSWSRGDGGVNHTLMFGVLECVLKI